MQSRLGLGVIGVLGVAAWLLTHGYQGVYHDGCLYALQALARLHPDLANDVFLKYGSQDQFSIFGRIYAAAVQAMGLEKATAVLTFSFQVAFLAAAWALARTFSSPRLALLGVCVLAAIPGIYGADRVFSCMETFLTPRMAAEALALAGLAAASASRNWLATGLIALAAGVHPLMAAPSIVCLYILHVAMPRPRWALAGIVAAVGLYAALAIGVGGTTWGRFDARWFALVDARSPYLFVTNWQWDDWSRAGVMLATLILGVAASEQIKQRAFVLAVLVTVLLGFAATLIACDWLHLILPTQLQPWRWQWLGTAVAALLLPRTLHCLWRTVPHGRCSSLLLSAAWIFADNTFAMAAAVAAVAAPLVKKLKPTEARHIAWSSWALLAMAGVWRIASNLEFTDTHYLDLSAPLWFLRTMSFARDGSVPLALIGLTWYLAAGRRRLPALIAVGAASLAGLLALAPHVWAMWTAPSYSPAAIADFAPLRRQIPAGSDVFWPEAPAAAWALLGAPSYLSVVQTSGMVFSRVSAVELERRAVALQSAISPGAFMGWDSAAEHMNLSREQLTQACDTGEFPYLVTHVDLGRGSEADLPTGHPPGNLHLYRCPAPRR